MKEMEFIVEQKKYVVQQRKQPHKRVIKIACLDRETASTKASEWERVSIGVNVSLERD